MGRFLGRFVILFHALIPGALAAIVLTGFWSRLPSRRSRALFFSFSSLPCLFHVLSALRVMAGGSPISSLFCKLVNRMEIETADFCDHENLASLFRFFSTNFTLSVKTLTDSTAKVRT
jgi:hypothetical protein